MKTNTLRFKLDYDFNTDTTIYSNKNVLVYRRQQRKEGVKDY
nr:MAG TPA: hypothetical protein [Caudoviricetes sp.]